jgi:uncharacterized membrane protein YdbT with pleckstrin-like domain
MEREREKEREEELFRELAQLLYDSYLSFLASNAEAMKNLPYEPVEIEEEEKEERKEEEKRKEERRKVRKRKVREGGKNKTANTPVERQAKEKEPSLEEKLVGLFIRSVSVVVATVLFIYAFKGLLKAENPFFFLISAVCTVASFTNAVLNILAILTGQWAIETDESPNT